MVSIMDENIYPWTDSYGSENPITNKLLIWIENIDCFRDRREIEANHSETWAKNCINVFASGW